MCSSERYDLPAILAVTALCAGAGTGSLIFLCGGLTISALAACVIRRSR